MQSWPVLYVAASAAAAATAGDIGVGEHHERSLAAQARGALVVGRRAAAAITRRPVAVEPVTVTMSVRSWVTSASPTSASPVTTLNTSAGTPASMASSARRMDVDGVAGAGLSTTLHPAASAAPTFHTAITSGKFHGVIAATSPAGRRSNIDV